MYPTWRQVLWELRWLIWDSAFVVSLQNLACPASVLFTRNLVVPAHRSLAMGQSFVTLGCRAWNALPHCMKILPTRASFVSAVRRMVCGVDAELFICFDARVLYLWNPP
jgi:hypothetical protein